MWPVGAGWPVNPATNQPLPLADGLQHLLATGGSGGLILWPLFGATNQLLAGFAFIVIAAWLLAKRKPIWMIAPAAVIMLLVPAAAMSWQAFIGNDENPAWIDSGKHLLVAIACVTLVLEAWLLGEVAIRWRRGLPGVLDELAPKNGA